MDLIVGKGQKSAILTLCERSVNYLIMTPLPGKGKNPREVAHAAIEALLPYKRYVKTITTDNGLEFMAHLSHKSQTPPSILQILTPPGKKAPLKTPTNS